MAFIFPIFDIVTTSGEDATYSGTLENDGEVNLDESAITETAAA